MNWTGNDDANGSGIASFDVYVSDNGANFSLWLDNTTLTEASYRGQPGKTYAFYTISVDNVGNTDIAPATAQATTQVANSTRNQAPILSINSGLTLNEAATSTIAPILLQTSDPDNSPAQLTYTLTALPTRGILKLNNNTLLLNGQFSQADIDNNALNYIHDGSETSFDRFNFTISDGENTLNDTPFGITINPVNDLPLLNQAIALFAIPVGQPLSFTFAEDTFTDSDLNEVLTYTATLANGYPLPGWLTFSGTTRTFGGTPTAADAGTLNLKVVATDTAQATANNTFSLTILGSDRPPVVSSPLANLTVDEDAENTSLDLANVFSDADGDAITNILFANTNTSLVFASILNNQLILDYLENKYGTATLTIRGSSNGQSVENTFTVTVNPVNDVPTINQPIIEQIASEGSFFNFIIPANTFADIDVGDALTYAVTLSNGNPLPSWLAFNAATHTLSGTPISENIGAIDVKITATDGSSATVNNSFKLSVADVNQPPTAVALTNTIASLAENSYTNNRIKVADIAISDDTLGTNSIFLQGADVTAFEVDGTALFLKAGTSLNYETKTAYAVTVLVDDTTISGSSPVTTGYNLAISDVNEAPTAVAFTTNTIALLAENTNTSSRIMVADIAVSDDAIGSNSIYLQGVDAAAFEVDGTVLFLKAGTSLNYETKTAYAVTVLVSDSTIVDSSPVSTSYSLAVTDLNEAPTLLALSATAFDENIPANTLVASLSSSDPDSMPQGFSYALVAGTGDTDNLAFYVTGNELHITRSPDYELKSSFNVRLRTIDQGGLSFDRNVQLTVNDLADSPSYSFSTSGSVVYEGSAINIGISSQNVAPTTKVYWSFSGTGITGSDVTDGILNGTSTLGADGRASFIKTIAADGVIEGDEGMEIKFFSDSNRSQQLGSILAVTLKEPSVGTVTDGPDIITGTAAAEIITGVPVGSTLRGKGTVDKLTGGAGNDIFLLGDSQGIFYDDGNSVVQSTLDLAWITDFASGDKIGLYGSAVNYQLISARYAGFKGVQINALLNSSTPEPIGFVQNATLATLALADANQFSYF